MFDTFDDITTVVSKRNLLPADTSKDQIKGHIVDQERLLYDNTGEIDWKCRLWGKLEGYMGIPCMMAEGSANAGLNRLVRF